MGPEPGVQKYTLTKEKIGSPAAESNQCDNVRDLLVRRLGLECSTCSKHLLAGNVYQCTRGHLVCSQCKKRKGCQTCKNADDTPYYRSLVTEKLLSADRFLTSFTGEKEALEKEARDILTASIDFECPCCLDVPGTTVKVGQCSQGHIICRPCWAQLNKLECPMCKEDYHDERPLGRCLILERMIKEFDIVEAL